ncbi:MAG: class I SAM-dependent RNA methyltransferase [Microbacteriaceae bacterium]
MDTVELEITTMAHGGSGIGRLDGRVVFCPGVIPGEVVSAQLVETSKKSLWRAEALSIIFPSPHRRPHIWAEADISQDPDNRAGGADYGHIELGHQRELKTGILRDSLQRFGGLSGEIIEQIEVIGLPGDDEANGLGWRTRVNLHANDDGVLGPFAERSHTVIPVSSLPLASIAIRESGVLDTTYRGASSVRALDTSGSGVRLIIDQQSPSDITETVGSTTFHLSDHSFWQVHTLAPATLSAAVTSAVVTEHLHPDAPNADLYSGVGLLGRALAELAGETLSLTAVESDDAALNYVQRNLAGVADVTAVSARVDRWLSEQVTRLTSLEKQRWSKATVILDPPRNGAKGDVIKALVALGVGQIVYVACDPVALGRDAGMLTTSGYELVFAKAWDLFPHTHHMETVATFIKAGG